MGGGGAGLTHRVHTISCSLTDPDTDSDSDLSLDDDQSGSYASTHSSDSEEEEEGIAFPGDPGWDSLLGPGAERLSLSCTTKGALLAVAGDSGLEQGWFVPSHVPHPCLAPPEGGLGSAKVPWPGDYGAAVKDSGGGRGPEERLRENGDVLPREGSLGPLPGPAAQPHKGEGLVGCSGMGPTVCPDTQDPYFPCTYRHPQEEVSAHNW